MNIVPKIYNDWVKNVDFLIKTYFWSYKSLFFASVSMLDLKNTKISQNLSYSNILKASEAILASNGLEIWSWISSPRRQNRPKFDLRSLQTLLVVSDFKIVQILKGHKIAVP